MAVNEEYNRMVSVFMITYNHEFSIIEAIESVLMQKTNFKIELIIGEDCSTDRTREICIEYKNKYPDIVKLLLPEKNVGAVQNTIQTLENCSGKYIAFCEGDDYWTDRDKLQKQVDFMENHPDYGLIHTAFCIKSLYSSEDVRLENPHTGTVFKELLRSNEIGTLTTLIRSEPIKSFLVSYSENPIPIIDYTFWLHVAQTYKIHYLDDFTAVYRKLPESASNTLDPVKKRSFDRKVLDIKIYYATQNNCLSLIEDQIIAFEKEELIYAFYTKNRVISEEAHKYLSDKSAVSAKDSFLYYGTKYQILRIFVRGIMYLKNK